MQVPEKFLSQFKGKREDARYAEQRMYALKFTTRIKTGGITIPIISKYCALIVTDVCILPIIKCLSVNTATILPMEGEVCVTNTTFNGGVTATLCTSRGVHIKKRNPKALSMYMKNKVNLSKLTSMCGRLLRNPVMLVQALQPPAIRPAKHSVATSGNMRTDIFRTMFIPNQPENNNSHPKQLTLFDL